MGTTHRYFYLAEFTERSDFYHPFGYNKPEPHQAKN